MITDVGHAAFRVKSIEDSLAFYEKLGIRESFRLHHDDGSLMLIYLHVAGDRFIEIFPGGSGQQPDQKSSFMHMCLVTDDIQATVETLRQQGITIDQEIKEGRDHNLQAWIKDPDGNDIELMQLSESSPQRGVARAAKSKG